MRWLESAKSWAQPTTRRAGTCSSLRARDLGGYLMRRGWSSSGRALEAFWQARSWVTWFVNGRDSLSGMRESPTICRLVSPADGISYWDCGGPGQSVIQYEGSLAGLEWRSRVRAQTRP